MFGRIFNIFFGPLVKFIFSFFSSSVFAGVSNFIKLPLILCLLFGLAYPLMLVYAASISCLFKFLIKLGGYPALFNQRLIESSKEKQVSLSDALSHYHLPSQSGIITAHPIRTWSDVFHDVLPYVCVALSAGIFVYGLARSVDYVPGAFDWLKVKLFGEKPQLTSQQPRTATTVRDLLSNNNNIKPDYVAPDKYILDPKILTQFSDNNNNNNSIATTSVSYSDFMALFRVRRVGFDARIVDSKLFADLIVEATHLSSATRAIYLNALDQGRVFYTTDLSQLFPKNPSDKQKILAKLLRDESKANVYTPHFDMVKPNPDYSKLQKNFNAFELELRGILDKNELFDAYKTSKKLFFHRFLTRERSAKVQGSEYLLGVNPEDTLAKIEHFVDALSSATQPSNPTKEKVRELVVKMIYEHGEYQRDFLSAQTTVCQLPYITDPAVANSIARQANAFFSGEALRVQDSLLKKVYDTQIVLPTPPLSTVTLIESLPISIFLNRTELVAQGCASHIAEYRSYYNFGIVAVTTAVWGFAFPAAAATEIANLITAGPSFLVPDAESVVFSSTSKLYQLLQSFWDWSFSSEQVSDFRAKYERYRYLLQADDRWVADYFFKNTRNAPKNLFFMIFYLYNV